MAPVPHDTSLFALKVEVYKTFVSLLLSRYYVYRTKVIALVEIRRSLNTSNIDVINNNFLSVVIVDLILILLV